MYKSLSKDPTLEEEFISSDKFMLYLILFHWFLASTFVAIPYESYLMGFVVGGGSTLFSCICDF